MTQKSDIGYFAEDLAAEYLEKKGYKIIDRNYRKPWGELDLVATKEGIVIFVEVKANTYDSIAFDPALRAGNEKLHKVVRTAQLYLDSKKFSSEQNWQIDLVTVIIEKGKETAKITHFKNIETG